MNDKLIKIYDALALASVFIGVKNRPVFKAFERYCAAQTPREKREAYAAFVSLVYEHGGSLTELVKKEVFEDENTYVKRVARGEKAGAHLARAVKRELACFSALAALKPCDFALDMALPEEEIPSFSSVNADMGASYARRLKHIDRYGYGIFSSHGMFRLSDEKEIEPIVSADAAKMDAFVGYKEEREKIVENTRAFVAGRPAANALLCGDAGTGKSSTVKAVANAFYDRGVRLIELRKDQLAYLPFVMGKIVGNPLKFIIFIDDLAFNRSDDHFSMLKAALEGSASAKADNAVIYATSNRRHIIKENFADRNGDDVHINDTLQETLSLSERFGLVVLFSKPSKQLYLEIVRELAKKKGISRADLEVLAEAFALKKGSRSPRCAEQFIDSLL